MSTLESERAYRQGKAEDLYRHGRSALAAHEPQRARALLLQAVEYDRGLSDAWLWLTATTSDPAEQKQYLDWAIAADPGNVTARRGLGLLTGQINPADLAPAEVEAVPAPAPLAEPPVVEDVVIRRTFECPQCGGRLRFDPALVDVLCENCGYVETVVEEPLTDEAVLDFTLPTRQSRRWAEAERRFTCGQCGAGTVLPVGATSPTCPFCGSAALVAAPEEGQLLPPLGVMPMALEAPAALKQVRAWLGRGWLAPDDLVQLARQRPLQPVYVPVWRFSSSLTTHWRARVTESGPPKELTHWHMGENTFFYPRWLQPGVRALPTALLRGVEPFDFGQLVRYKPEYLAGWPAGTYDLPLAQAALEARAGMLQDALRQLGRKILPGRLVTEWQVSGSDFTGQTYQLLLLPLWIGNYQYQGRRYRVLINGQTGQVAGDKPRDPVKLTMVIGMAVIGALLAVGLLVAAWPLLDGLVRAVRGAL